jgi:transcription factor-like protein
LLILSRADIQSANVLSRLPRLAPLDTLLDPASLTNPFTPLIGSQETDFYTQQAEFYAIDIRLTNIFVELQQLTALLGEDPVFDLRLSDVVYTLQRRLMCLVYDVNERIEPIERTYCFAGLIFLECYIRSVRPNSDIAKVLNDRLHSSMMELPMRPAGDQSKDGGTPELWFWALFVGALAATEKREWFVSQLVQACTDMQLFSLEDVESLLCRVCWARQNSTLGSHLLWREIVDVSTATITTTLSTS